ncbi:Thioredoxin peroxidase [Lecanosticta acicola]|uniref:Thioredoxin peroxidase n=1 Tax=Lecanosticta acicola TaxID=111012 RepID=A0AAI8Z9J9_9PEZI|nr:Thioredoxin peroxidase [Lecanosticta acicola]
MYHKVQVGHPAPDFKATAVVDGRFKHISLSSYVDANHWLILVFFPKAWSFICPTEIKAFSARLDEFLYKRSCAVVFCSTDNEHCLKAWNDTEEMEGGLGGVHIPLLSDINHKISREYGVLIEDEGVAQRALFIIDPKGRIRNITVNDADVGRSVDEAQRILDALIFKDEFGEGCPIDWKKGDKGIDVKTKTSVDGNYEIPKRLTNGWTSWARPKLSRAWSGASAHSITGAANKPVGIAPTSAGQTPAERDRSHSNLGSYPTLSSSATSVDHSPIGSPTSMNTKTFEVQLDEAINAQKNTQTMLDNMQAQMHNTSLGVGVAS